MEMLLIEKNLWEEIKFDETLTGLEDINFGLYANI